MSRGGVAKEVWAIIPFLSWVVGWPRSAYTEAAGRIVVCGQPAKVGVMVMDSETDSLGVTWMARAGPWTIVSTNLSQWQWVAAKGKHLTSSYPLLLLRIGYAITARCIKQRKPLLDIKKLVNEYGRWTMKLPVWIETWRTKDAELGRKWWVYLESPTGSIYVLTHSV